MRVYQRASNPLMTLSPRLAMIKTWQWLLALTLFLGAQTAGLIHAQVHEFDDHVHTVYCDAFENAVEPTLETPQLTAVWQDFGLASRLMFGSLPAGEFVTFYRFLVRAPPIS